MKYNYNDNTLIHSIGFNFAKLESILQNGILSQNKAKEMSIPYARNYQGYNLDDTISCIRYLYINRQDTNSAYVKYTTDGISFIIENTPFIYSKDERIINHSDEVLVEGMITLDKIKGIIIRPEYLNVSLKDLNYLPLDSTSYINTKNTCDNLISYLQKYNYQVDKEEYNCYLRDLYMTNNAIRSIKDKNSPDYTELITNFKEVVNDMNAFFQVEIYICFAKYMNNKNITLNDLIAYINNKYYNLSIYDVPFNITKGKINES